MNKPTPVEKYLRSYAEPEAGAICPPLAIYRCVLTIPAYRETGTLLKQLDSLLKANPGVLVIVVINRPCCRVPTSTTSDAPQPADTELARLIRRRYRPVPGDTHGQYYDMGNGSTLLAIDRYSKDQGIPEHQGVGLARKIAADIACQFIDRGFVTSPWIHSSDADVCWPENYFDISLAAPRHASALLYPFRHQTAVGRGGLAVQLYEFSLRYYVAGLRWAGSPWAMHTIGSTIAIHYDNYAKVRGFPKRSAGEDFYILNKLAKTGPVVSLTEPCLLVADRPSDRVPFGTGPACSKIAALANPLEQYHYYHPQCFAELRSTLELMRQLAANAMPLQFWQAQLEAVPKAPFVSLLQDMGLGAAIEHATRQSHTPAQFSRHLTTWFDAFRTRKFIHGIRDRYYLSVPLRRILPEADFLLALLEEKTVELPDEPLQQVLAITALNHCLQTGVAKPQDAGAAGINELPS